MALKLFYKISRLSSKSRSLLRTEHDFFSEIIRGNSGGAEMTLKIVQSLCSEPDGVEMLFRKVSKDRKCIVSFLLSIISNPRYHETNCWNIDDSLENYAIYLIFLGAQQTQFCERFMKLNAIKTLTKLLPLSGHVSLKATLPIILIAGAYASIEKKPFLFPFTPIQV